MGASRPELFRGRHFRDEIIVLCVRWYLRYPLSYRDLEEMMAERGLTIDHSTIARWVLRYAPVLNQRIRWEAIDQAPNPIEVAVNWPALLSTRSEADHR